MSSRISRMAILCTWVGLGFGLGLGLGLPRARGKVAVRVRVRVRVTSCTGKVAVPRSLAVSSCFTHACSEPTCFG